MSLIGSLLSPFPVGPADEHGRGQQERFDAWPLAARCVRKRLEGGRFASLKRAAHGSGSGLAGKSNQSPPPSPERVGSDGSLYLNIVRLCLEILTERFGRQEVRLGGRKSLCQYDRTVRSPIFNQT